ncbi:hydroquinone glucosyltransferase-like [Impatiens glandulifera]|uniref:hydroquinone glucosyltransferase-like n=1 Tax=Impatiens glandulifera TaxID=253017 RepID=UPI001FB0895F|nr:hydroquinone glucosyltransferase-like [Impatiens glandulifera]
MATPENKNQKPRMIIIPAPGMGHLIPFVEFAKKMENSHQISSTFIFPDFGFPMKSQKSYLSQALTPSMSIVYLPPVPIVDLPADEFIATRIAHAVTRCVPALRKAIQDLSKSTRFASMIVSYVGTDAFSIADEFNLFKYVFMPIAAMTVALFKYLPVLDASCTCQYKDLTEKIKIPGCVEIDGSDVPDWVEDRESGIYKCLLYHSKRYGEADGILINNFRYFESGAFEFLSGENDPTVYPIGPLLKAGEGSGEDDNGSNWRAWLDRQPVGSVVYVCLGGSGTLSLNQIKEMALGLESSGHRFLWVVRVPSDTVGSVTFFDTQARQDPFNFLPDGFVDRVNESGKGMLVRSWAPQVEILMHESTGGFLTHGGWGSALESVVYGVPMIVWPLFAEHEMISALLSNDGDGLKVAIRVKKDEDGMVGRVELAKMVNDLMNGDEGKRIKENMVRVKEEANLAMRDGASYIELAKKWNNHNVM